MLVSARLRNPEAGMLLLATLLSATGIMVYSLDRGGTVDFLPDWTARSTGPAILGPLGYNLPTFLHPLILILVTAVILRLSLEHDFLERIANHAASECGS
jgi:hypothetical protein